MKSRDLKDTELTLILDQMTSLRDRALFIVGTKTGFRISELLSLRIEDVSQEDGSIRDTLTVHRRNMKGKRSSRSVPLHPQAKEALKCYLETGLVTNKLFPVTRQHAWRIISGAADKAGLSGTISTHSLRKTFGMNVYIRTGKNVVAAQKALGHESLASTTHYLSIGQDEVDAAILA